MCFKESERRAFNEILMGWNLDVFHSLLLWVACWRCEINLGARARRIYPKLWGLYRRINGSCLVVFMWTGSASGGIFMASRKLLVAMSMEKIKNKNFEQ
jgi:hypothetical protein